MNEVGEQDTGSCPNERLVNCKQCDNLRSTPKGCAAAAKPLKDFKRMIAAAAMGWRICLLNLPVERPYYLT